MSTNNYYYHTNNILFYFRYYEIFIKYINYLVFYNKKSFRPIKPHISYTSNKLIIPHFS